VEGETTKRNVVSSREWSQSTPEDSAHYKCGPDVKGNVYKLKLQLIND